LRNVKLVCRCIRWKVDKSRWGTEWWAIAQLLVKLLLFVFYLPNHIILVTNRGREAYNIHIMKSILANGKIYFSAGRFRGTWNARKHNLCRESSSEYLVDRLVSGSRQCTVRKTRKMKTIVAWTDRFFFSERTVVLAYSQSSLFVVRRVSVDDSVFFFKWL